ncbi:MAG: RimK family alpha-L-glutamate ligase [Lachnospiraceae bacterium]|nr:RimK family alpha-L-glutamate ligase [Lachnospiraceae bacterium]
MKGWLIVNSFLKNEKFHELEEMFHSAAKGWNMELQTVENAELLADTSLSSWEFPSPDFVIFWDKDILLAEFLEGRGLRVYNSSRCIALCDDKRKTHLALERKQLPMPRTILAPMSYSGIGFTHLDFLLQVEEILSYPMVVKEAYGSFGAQVCLVNSREELVRCVERCQTTELLFQEYIEYSHGRDVRIQVVGDRVIGAMYRYSDRDFRANVTAGGRMKAYSPSEEECRLARMAAQAVEADFAGVDLLFGPEGPLVCEVNSNAHFKNLLDCTGIHTAEEIMDYIRRDISAKK